MNATKRPVGAPISISSDTKEYVLKSYSEIGSYTGTASFLNSESYPSPRGRKWYASTVKGVVVGWSKEHPEKRYRVRREFIDSMKRQTPCADCGNKFPPECMDFDHVRGDKVGGISSMFMAPMAALEAELAKCEIVCANCHRIRTRKRLHQDI
jgi:hypothetical protein